MKTAAWARLVRPLVGDRWKLRGALAYITPVGWVLHGVLGESSATSTGFYLWRVRMPMYAPADVIDLSWSGRIGPSTVYPIDRPGSIAVVREAISQIVLATGTTEYLPPPSADLSRNARISEAYGYQLIVQGNLSKASSILKRVSSSPASLPWELEIVQRSNWARSLIERRREAEVVDQLKVWRARSAEALGIEVGPI